MIRSSKVSTKFSNKSKLDDLDIFISEYTYVTKQFINILWNKEKIPTLLPKEITSKIDTWLSKRILQCAGKQASGIVRGTRKKQHKRKYIIEKLKKEAKHKEAKKLQKIYDKVKMSKPNIENLNPELDSRFIKIDLKNKTSFDGWMTISSIGNKMKIKIPFKKTKHFNKIYKKGKLKNGIRINIKNITFMFEIQNKKHKTKGKIVGIDIGQKTTISCSNGFVSKKNKHGHDLNSILKRLSKKQKGSKGFKREQEHRKNYINWTINQLNLEDIKQVNRENIKNLRKNKKSSRQLAHWTYTNIFDKLDRYCEEQGVLVVAISPTYTSQRCSKCGWTQKINRKGKLFNCASCGFAEDADLNASRNISLPLLEISKSDRLLQANRKGFYWLEEGQENIVPVVQNFE